MIVFRHSLISFVTNNLFVCSVCIPPLDMVVNSTASHSTSGASIDEGGFNEPSPEIKAKLKPAYTYETVSTTPNEKEDGNDTTDDLNQHSLHYVDFGYRLNPDGSESKQCYSEDQYDIAQNVNGVRSAGVERQRCDKRTVHYPVADSVVYAAIKSEPSSLSPPFEPKFNYGKHPMPTVISITSKHRIDYLLRHLTWPSSIFHFLFRKTK